MREVLLTDVALWSALIVTAALIIIRRWRRSHSRIPARGPRGDAPEIAGQKMSAPKAASRTGRAEDIRVPDGAAPRSARPAPRAPSQAMEAAPSQAMEMADPKARPRRPGAQRDDRQAPTAAPTKAATPSEQIVSYYDQADQPIADYLAALGWSQHPPTPPTSQHAHIRVPPQRRPPRGRPAP